MSRGTVELKRTGSLKRTPFKPAPKNDYERELDALRPLIRQRSQGRCEIGLPGCQGIAVHPHHRKRRSQGGRNDLRNLLHCCRSCHDWAHAHVAEAVSLGIIVPSWAEVGPISEVRDAVKKYLDSLPAEDVS
jgi:hypothetical protein